MFEDWGTIISRSCLYVYLALWVMMIMSFLLSGGLYDYGMENADRFWLQSGCFLDRDFT
jgi:hypothetical protein